MTTQTLTAAVLAALAIGTLTTVQAAPPKAKISPAQAKAAALKKIPGKATAAKYEYEDGHWQYAVAVTDKSGQMYEAEVNATTGKVTATEKTSAAEEASEAAADAKAAKKAHSANKTSAKTDGEANGEQSETPD